MINKKHLINNIIKTLDKERQQAIDAANEAHAAAVDDQSVAETQYDTLAIEAGYLAEGQSKRVAEFQQAVDAYSTLEISDFTEDSLITLGALVQLSNDSSDQHWFFIGPAAGGYRCIIEQEHITVITPKSPMGEALIGKQQDDDIDINIGTNKLMDYIAKVQ